MLELIKDRKIKNLGEIYRKEENVIEAEKMKIMLFV